MDDKLVNSLTPKLLGERPNTYTYTKALAESLLVEECGRLPVAIVRPSIVTASWREPLPGWVDNTNAATGLILNIGKGLIRIMRSNERACVDLIPVDTVINLMIAVAWYTATQRPDSVLVYNSSSGLSNKIIYREFEEYSVSTWRLYPSDRTFRYPVFRFTESIILIKFSHYFNHIIPAYFYDAFLAITGRERKYVIINNFF
jgi:fatty acyl-CoA reductase